MDTTKGAGKGCHNVMVDLQELLSLLGYDASSHYRRSVQQFEPETAHLFRTARKAGVDGAYVVQASSRQAPSPLPARPAVYVAKATTEDQAREIHRNMWNLGSAPFLLIVLPNQIKVYTAFDYEPLSDKRGLWPMDERGLLHTLDNPADVVARLAHFSAEAIDTGRIWESADYLDRVDPLLRVNERLLSNLSQLDAALQSEGGLDSEVAHALIGKYVYIRYLRDRNILSDEWLDEQGIDWSSVFGRAPTVAGLAHLVNALEARFNGKIFPVNLAGDKAPEDKHVGLVAAVFLGDEIVASEADGVVRQLHLDFQAYRFDYIPIETLSSVYEQFIDDRKLKGAIYTPEVLADYLLSEMDAVKELTPAMKVLDPACGSGVFLVLALRRLIEQHIAASADGCISLAALTDLLANMYGVERELDACYVTEFSLLLTILHYIDLPELHKHAEFQFPNLHNMQIFNGDFFDESLALWRRDLRFDWIVGNPPWVKAKGDVQQKTDEAERHAINEEAYQKRADAWMKANISTCPVGDRSVAQAFSWRVGAVLADDGLVGLIMPATSLVNLKSRKYRQAFFAAHDVFRITNFANFRRFLFDGRSEAPAATIVYAKTSEYKAKPEIVHYGPFSVNQIPHLHGAPWSIVINGDEIQTVSPLEAERGETTTWKLALWGTHRDRRALERLQRLFPTTLEEYCKLQGWGRSLPQEGLQLRDSKGEGTNTAVKSSELADTNVFSLEMYNDRLHYRFWLPNNLLIPNSKEYIRERGGVTALRINKAPHILISAGWDFVVYSDVDFVIPPRQMGISAAPDSNAPQMSADNIISRQRRLKALCLYLNSTVVRYYLFFHSPEWGFDRRRESVVVTEVRKIPTPVFTEAQIVRLAAVYDELSRDEQDVGIEDAGRIAVFYQTQQEEVDDIVSQVCEIPDDLRAMAIDFIYTRLRLDQDQAATQQVIRVPSHEEFVQYAKELQNGLEDFMMGQYHPSVDITWSKDLTECVVTLPENAHTVDGSRLSVHEDNVSQSQVLGSISAGLRQRISQWAYIQRSLRLYDGPRIYLYKPTRLISWTRTQAMNDAADIIAYSIQGRAEG